MATKLSCWVAGHKEAGWNAHKVQMLELQQQLLGPKCEVSVPLSEELHHHFVLRWPTCIHYSLATNPGKMKLVARYATPHSKVVTAASPNVQGTFHV